MSDTMAMTSSVLLRAIRRLASRRGWPLAEREGKGSHLIVRLNGRSTTVPRHRGDLPAGTIRAILRQLRITEADLEERS